MATQKTTFPETKLRIVGPDGENPPSADSHSVLAMDIVRSQQIHLAKLQNKLSARQIRIMRVALEEMAARLAYLQFNDQDKWNQARMQRTMILLSRGIIQMVGTQESALTAGLKQVSRQSQKDAAMYLATLDRHFHGSVRPLNFDSLAWWEETHENIGRVRIRQYTNSWLRYGATVTKKIEDTLAKTTLSGEPWYTARAKVTEATYGAVQGNRYWVDRIVRTESSAVWNGAQLAALKSEDEEDDPMQKKLVAHFDDITGRDSVLLHGQTRPVDKPFWDAYNRITYMAPPNRPHDREVIVGWRTSYGEDFDDYDKETATGYSEEEHGPTKRDLDQTGQAEDPTGPLRVARPRRSIKVDSAEPTRAERRDQLQDLRFKRDYVTQQLTDARADTARLKAQAAQQGGRASEMLLEEYRTKAGLAVALTKQLEEYRNWIDMLQAGTMLRAAT